MAWRRSGVRIPLAPHLEPQRSEPDSAGALPHSDLFALLGGFEVLDDLLAGELAGRAHHAAARVGAGAALVVALDRRPVLAPAGGGPEEVHLRREELTGEDVPLGEA